MAQGLGTRRTQQTVDADLLLKAGGLEASTDEFLILDMGGGDQPNSPVVYYDVVIDVSAIEIASADEVYTFIMEGSNSATFASGIEELGSITLATGSDIPGNSDVSSDVGRYAISGSNERNGRTYRYLRLAIVIIGTIATGINFEAGLFKRV